MKKNIQCVCVCVCVCACVCDLLRLQVCLLACDVCGVCWCVCVCVRLCECAVCVSVHVLTCLCAVCWCSGCAHMKKKIQCSRTEQPMTPSGISRIMVSVRKGSGTTIWSRRITHLGWVLNSSRCSVFKNFIAKIGWSIIFAKVSGRA